MKKIWDAQSQTPLYAIDEAALHRQIRARRDRVQRWAHGNEIGLLLVCLVTPAILILIEPSSLNTYLTLAVLLGIGGYVWLRRRQRRQNQRRFERTIRGELEAAIANADYLVNLGRTFVWWFLLPLALVTLLNMVLTGVNTGKILLIGSSFLLAYYLVRWELRRIHRPRQRELEALREMLEP